MAVLSSDPPKPSHLIAVPAASDVPIDAEPADAAGAAEAVAPRAFPLSAIDGVALAAHHFAPAAGTPARGGVLIAPAIGVSQTFYAPFATWLASLGLHVVTFDYRGVGQSRSAPLRAVTADIVDWARLDATAALRALQDLAPELPITWIGHSLGGQIVPFIPDHRELAKIITIATGSGYWRENSPATRRKVWVLWYFAGPVFTSLFGYFPGKRLRIVGDLPAGVLRQWRRWCLDPNYAVGAEGPAVADLFARVTTPITSLSFTDDEMMSLRNTEALHASYTRAPVTFCRLDPASLSVARIGHFGWFRPASAPLWDRVLRAELAGL